MTLSIDVIAVARRKHYFRSVMPPATNDESDQLTAYDYKLGPQFAALLFKNIHFR